MLDWIELFELIELIWLGGRYGQEIPIVNYSKEEKDTWGLFFYYFDKLVTFIVELVMSLLLFYPIRSCI